jgi:hypothetical protein
MFEVTMVGLGFTLLNMVLLGLNMKLYTEYFKDRSANRRS